MDDVSWPIATARGLPADLAFRPSIAWHPSVENVPLTARGWDAEACVVDWSGNGEPELLITCRSGAQGWTTWLYRPMEWTEAGGLPIYDAGTLVPDLEGLRCLCPLPSGQNSRFDLVALECSGLVYLANRGDGQAPKFGSRTLLSTGLDLGSPQHRITQLTAVDWDQDSLIDLLVSCHDLDGYWPEGGHIPVSQQLGFDQHASHPGYDVQGLWRGASPRSRIYWLRNHGGETEHRFSLESEIQGESGPLDIGLNPAALVISWGGRGSPELLTSDDRGLLRIYRNFGGQLPPILMESRPVRRGGAPLTIHADRTSIAVAVIDRDRRPELIYGTSTGQLFAIHAGAGRDEAHSPQPILQRAGEVLLGGHAAFVACDLDADGDLDLLWGDGAGRLPYLEDLGRGDDHQYGLPLLLEAGGVPFRMESGPEGRFHGPDDLERGFARPALADWLDHGRLDLIVTGAGGDVLILPHDGSPSQPRFGLPQRICHNGKALLLPPRVQSAIAAWTSPDGLDLIALDLQGFLCAFPQVDRFEVGDPRPIVDRLGRLIRLDGGFGQAGQCSIWAGHWTSQDRIDLLIGLPRGNRHVIPALTGTPLVDVDSLPTVLLLENMGDGVVVPRPLRFKGGLPIVGGLEGCCPQGVPRLGSDLPDLLLLGDEGVLRWIARDEIRW